MTGGANKPSLTEAQRNFAALGASNTRFTDRVRAPNSQDVRDPEWRLIEAPDVAALDSDVRFTGSPSYPSDSTQLYYWKKIAVYVRLLGEGTEVYRLVPAKPLSSSVYVLGGQELHDPDDEEWEFLPEANVRVETRILSGEAVLVAIGPG
jgi:hypothetical protein